MRVATITAHFNDRRRAPRFLRGARRSFYGTYAPAVQPADRLPVKKHHVFRAYFLNCW